jgi:hypothetical protein
VSRSLLCARTFTQITSGQAHASYECNSDGRRRDGPRRRREGLQFGHDAVRSPQQVKAKRDARTTTYDAPIIHPEFHVRRFERAALDACAPNLTAWRCTSEPTRRSHGFWEPKKNEHHLRETKKKLSRSFFWPARPWHDASRPSDPGTLEISKPDLSAK